MSKIDEKLGEVIDKLTKLAETHGGAAAELAISVAQTNAIASLVSAAISMILCIGAALVANKLIRYAVSHPDEIDWPAPGYFIPGIILAGVAAVASLFSLSELVSVWNWTGAFNPKLALAKQIMKAAGL